MPPSPPAAPADVVRGALAALDQVKPANSGATRTRAGFQAAFNSALETIGI